MDEGVSKPIPLQEAFSSSLLSILFFILPMILHGVNDDQNLSSAEGVSIQLLLYFTADWCIVESIELGTDEVVVEEP